MWVDRNVSLLIYEVSIWSTKEAEHENLVVLFIVIQKERKKGELEVPRNTMAVYCPPLSLSLSLSLSHTHTLYLSLTDSLTGLRAYALCGFSVSSSSSSPLSSTTEQPVKLVQTGFQTSTSWLEHACSSVVR